MPKVTEEFLQARRDEIINACAKLYETMSFKEVTLKEIGKETSFNRTSIYNYFETKEEIFLALMQREYDLWVEELEAMIGATNALSRDELAKTLAHSLEKRGCLLKLLSMNLFDIEENSRYEKLVEFKKSYGNAIKTIRHCIDKFCPDMEISERQEIVYAFFPFLFGIYPYTVVTDNQKQAMKDADLDFVYQSVYEITYRFLKRMFSVNS